MVAAPLAAITPSRLPSALARALLALGVAVVALAWYHSTLAPTISWANGGADSGDLATAVATLGIPHPPGYPTYVLLGRAWTELPLGGDLAYRLNLFSAAGAALAAGLGAVTITLLAGSTASSKGALAAGAALGGLTGALAPLTWSQATIAEVYTPGLAALSLFSLVVLAESRPGWRQPLAGLLAGLGLGMLPQLALAAPGAVGLLLARSGWRALRPRRLLLTAAAGAMGVSTFAYLPWRAASQPVANWGDPSTPDRFWAVVSAAQYRPILSSLTADRWLGRLVESLTLLAGELSLAGACLALVGGGVLWRVGRARFGYLLSLVVLAVLFRTSYPAEGNAVYLLPALYGLALLTGVGAVSLLRLAGRSGGHLAPALVALALFALLGLRATLTARAVDASADREAEAFGERVLATLPPGALVVSGRDETTFSLWYRQAAGARPDVVVVDSRLLFWSWYQRSLAQRYPDLNPAAVRPGGLSALRRPLYVLEGPPGEEVARAVPAAPR